MCPMRLMPPNFETAYGLKDFKALRDYKLNMCVECGSCAYVCPAKRPLVQAIQLSKEALWQHEQLLKREQERKDAAKADTKEAKT